MKIQKISSKYWKGMHNAIDWPKKFEPDILNTFWGMYVGLKNQDFEKSAWVH